MPGLGELHAGAPGAGALAVKAIQGRQGSSGGVQPEQADVVAGGVVPAAEYDLAAVQHAGVQVVAEVEGNLPELGAAALRVIDMQDRGGVVAILVQGGEDLAAALVEQPRLAGHLAGGAEYDAVIGEEVRGNIVAAAGFHALVALDARGNQVLGLHGCQVQGPQVPGRALQIGGHGFRHRACCEYQGPTVVGALQPLHIDGDLCGRHALLGGDGGGDLRGDVHVIGAGGRALAHIQPGARVEGQRVAQVGGRLRQWPLDIGHRDFQYYRILALVVACQRDTVTAPSRAPRKPRGLCQEDEQYQRRVCAANGLVPYLIGLLPALFASQLCKLGHKAASKNLRKVDIPLSALFARFFLPLCDLVRKARSQPRGNAPGTRTSDTA